MTDKDKPFICYKSGLNLKITPRNAAGWRSFAVWMAAIFGLTGGFIVFVTRSLTPDQIIYATAGFTILILALSVAMIRWMYVRSEVVDMNELLELKRERERQTRRGRR
jgi:4-amino-4-deoxy-L-arabinose transferase-like glycosyltransferase